MIKLLEEKGYTYKTSDGIYFDSSKFKDYGKLSRKNIEELQGGCRIRLGEKKHKTDFALWKFSEEPGKRQQEWDSPWGLGFPGWHLECSAMSTKYLGKQFDIHTGGEDHIPIHHENEIAQSECALGVHPWVNYWMHNAFLQIPGGKMSKSSGNIQTISQLEEQGFSPLDYKYFIYSAHYRKPLTWSMKGLESAKKGLNKLRKQISEMKDDEKENKSYLKEFEEAINDDLNLPNALAVLHKLVSDNSAKGKFQTIKKMDEVFALDLFNYEVEKIEIPEEIKKLAEKRLNARGEKDWAESDKLRNEISKKGYEILDTKEGYEIKKK
jgi:cysteinyl-tRNA synthetase